MENMPDGFHRLWIRDEAGWHPTRVGSQLPISERTARDLFDWVQRIREELRGLPILGWEFREG